MQIHQVKTEIRFSEGNWKFVDNVNAENDISKNSELKGEFEGFGYKVVLAERMNFKDKE